MPKSATRTAARKSRQLIVLEYVLLGVCLCVLGLRVSYPESPTARPATTPENLSDTIYSLSVSAVLIFSLLVWLVWSLLSGRVIYRPGGMEVGLFIWIVATVIAGFAAADKRLAITSSVVLLAPVLMGVLLVQILDSRQKVYLGLAVIAALAIVNAQQSADQFLSSNQAAIDAYEQDPRGMLEPLGIEPGTFQAFLYEHRIYSRGIRGFFTTRNSAGSFMLMACFVTGALFIEQFSRAKRGVWLYLLGSGAAVVVVFLSLAVTRSKGAFMGLIAAVGVFLAYLRRESWLRTHRRALFCGCLLLGGAIACLVGLWGLTRGSLPGGSSMLVRWQYWQAAARMYVDHPITGVGPGNFSSYYTHYKPEAALESVADPHNFVLSILAQFGPLGLLGFLAVIAGPLLRVLCPVVGEAPAVGVRKLVSFRHLAVVYSIFVALGLLIVRPIIFPLPPGASAEERQAAILILYLTPVLVFLAGMLLVSAGLRPAESGRRSVVCGALFGAAVGVLVHSQIDFAIFEPGVFTTFWAIVACLVAGEYQRNPRKAIEVTCPRAVGGLGVVAAGLVGLAFFGYAFVPVVKSGKKICAAHRAISIGRFDEACELLDSAARDDSLSLTALSLKGKLCLRQFELSGKSDRGLLVEARDSFLTAIVRNPASFKNFEWLCETYMLLAETSPPEDKRAWVDQAYWAATQAVERYGGCARLRVQLGRIAEELGRTEVAIQQYSKAIEIEDSYRQQFKMMYPERQEVVSRLERDKYLFAKDRLGSLLQEKRP